MAILTEAMRGPQGGQIGQGYAGGSIASISSRHAMFHRTKAPHQKYILLL